jgi:alpha-L-fucosidase 2
MSSSRKSVAALAVVLLGAIRGGANEPAQGPRRTSVPTVARLDVDWPAYMSRNDLVWSKPPAAWESGAFMGNGLLGANVFATADGANLLWRIGRTDVVAGDSRLPIGDLVLKTAGTLKGASLRLDLWNAEMRGTITTDKGEIQVRSFTHTQDLVQVIELKPSEGEKNVSWEWLPGEALNPRYRHNRLPIPPEEINPSPNIALAYDGRVDLAAQPLKIGGGYATGWVTNRARDGALVTYVTVGSSTKDLQLAKTEVLGTLAAAEKAGIARLTASHRRWWNDFYPKSFLSIPDSRLESFYWIQLYKMASGTRADRPILDLMGPWFRNTPWPRIWWNLNIQLTYWPQLVSNHLDLGESLTRGLDRNKAALAKNAAPFSADSYGIGRSTSYDMLKEAVPEIGNLPWTLHNYYLQYRYSMDEPMLRDRLFPLLKGSVNYYLNLLKEGPDGYLHITLGLSPEYPAQPTPNPDTNFDLSLLRWGVQTLLETCERFDIKDRQIPVWKRTLEKLVPYPVDENGYKVSASMPFAVSHRHYSHLMMVYPLYLVNLDQPENKDLVVKSLNHWMGLEQALRGYSFTGASSISSIMGRGDDALKYLNMFFEHGRFGILSNTMYTESGPVIETPLSAARSVHDMLLSSWGDKIRLFPALPAAWRDVTIHKMRTEGAFLVSAVRKDGATRFLQIESLAGAPCVFVTDMVDPKGSGATVTKIGERTYKVDLQKGQTVVLTPGGAKADLTMTGVAAEAGRTNYWGLNEHTKPSLSEDAKR